MKTLFGLGLAAWGLLACSDAVLDLGTSDGGQADVQIPIPEVLAFSAEAVQGAERFCRDAGQHLPLNLGPQYTPYSEAELRNDLAGGWFPCAVAHKTQDNYRSFQFTVDNRWYTLVDTGGGGLRRGEIPGYDGGVIGFEGTYRTASDSPDGGAQYLVTRGQRWFHPEFEGRWMYVSFLADGSSWYFVSILP